MVRSSNRCGREKCASMSPTELLRRCLVAEQAISEVDTLTEEEYDND